VWFWRAARTAPGCAWRSRVADRWRAAAVHDLTAALRLLEGFTDVTVAAVPAAASSRSRC